MTPTTLMETPEPSRPMVERIFDALKNPVHAALLAAAYLIWFLTAKVDASQKAIKEQLDQQTQAISALVNEAKDQKGDRRVQTSILRMICIGVNKGNAQTKCGDER